MRTRAFTSGLGLGRVLFNDLYRYTFFFSARHRRAAGTFFFFVGNQELIRSEAPLSSRLQVTHARCIFFYAVVIAVERSRRVCARSFRRVEKKMGEGGEREKKRKTLAHFTHTTRRFSSRAGDKTPRDAQIIIRVAFSRLFAGSLKSRAIRRDLGAKKIFPPLAGMGRERERERNYSISNAPLRRRTSFLVHRHRESGAFCVTGVTGG